MARKNDTFTFTVRGSGEFPYDMLRYDACWPYSEGHDSPHLSSPNGHGPRTVVLQTQNPHAPTVRRWESFTWKVLGKGELRDGDRS